MAKIRWFESLDSTNTYAVNHFSELTDGDLVVAGTQTAGRGRLQREWYSPVGNLYASFVLKELFGEPFMATIISSLAVLAVIRKCAPEIPAVIKWPNDIMVNNKKICGILCEGIIRNGAVTGMVCGIGLNVNSTQEEMNNISQPATSMRALLRHETSPTFIAEQLSLYLNWYNIARIRSAEDVYSQWKAENAVIGKEVELLPPDGRAYKTQVLDISRDGKLMVNGRTGGVTGFSCGDIKILKQQEG